jgi:predicted nucleic acid-binding protein
VGHSRTIRKSKGAAYQDKPKMSFTNLTSMVIMKELGFKEIMTGNEHFEHVGMAFQR